MTSTTLLEAQAALAALAEEIDGTLSVATRPLDDSAPLQLDADRIGATASAIKLPILIALLAAAEEGDVDLDQRVPLAAETRVGGSGVLKLLDAGLEPTVRDLATLMIATSDNTATNVLIRLLGGVRRVNEQSAKEGYGAIALNGPVDFSAISLDPRNLGAASMSDFAGLLHKVARRALVSPWVSAETERILRTQLYLDQVPRFYRVDPYVDDLGSTADVSVACKTGFLPGLRVDVGIVRWAGGGFAYAVSVHTPSDESFAVEAAPASAAGRVGRVLLAHHWPPALGRLPLIDTPAVAPLP